MTLKEILTKDQTAAMKAKLKAVTEDEKVLADVRLATLRALNAAISEAETSGKVRKELTDDDVIALLKREASKRIETAKIFEDAGAHDRAIRERNESDIVKEYLPAESSPEDIQEFVENFVKENGLAGVGGRAMGRVMTALKAKFENFDAKTASDIVKKFVF